jgi:hypothetical protein
MARSEHEFADERHSHRASWPTAEGGVMDAVGNMMQQFEAIQKASKEQIDSTLKAFGTTSKSVQAIAVEATDYAKKSYEQSAAAFEKLSAVKTLDKAIEIQSDFAKTAFEGAVAQATKIGELYSSLLKDMYKPFEAAVAKVVPATK